MKSRIENFIDEVNNNLTSNYLAVEDIFNKEYDYLGLDPIRDEICKCLICGLPQAAITLTNHLLEAFLKKCLAMKFSIENKNVSTTLLDATKDGIAESDNWGLYRTINQACLRGLITEKQKQQLHVFRQRFRNPYGHATMFKTFGNATLPIKIMSLNDAVSPEELLSKIFDNKGTTNVLIKDFLPVQGIAQAVLSKDVSLQYFRDIDAIIRDILLGLENNKGKE